MRKNAAKLLAIIVVMCLGFSNAVLAISSVSSEVDENGYYTITTSDKLNLNGITRLTLPIAFTKETVAEKYLEMNGDTVSATLRVVRNSISIIPKSKLTAGITYSVKLTTKSGKKYVMNIVAKSEQTVDASDPSSGTASEPALTKDADGYYVLTSDGYLNTTIESTVLLPMSFRNIRIDAITMEYDNQFAPAEIEIANNKMSVLPAEDLIDGAVYNIRIFAADDTRYVMKLKAYNIKSIDFSKHNIYRIPANPAKGFNIPYYMYVPAGADKSKYKKLIVEGNNSDANLSDYQEFYDEKAKNIVTYGGAGGRFVAESLKAPLIVPAIPRFNSNWFLYTYLLDRDTLMSQEENIKRLDLQLIAMIKDAKAALEANGLKLDEKINMIGFSASALFANRFSLLHPEVVNALFIGGLNSTLVLPVSSLEGNNLRYPVGIADIEEIAGIKFNEAEYRKIAQFIYMGGSDFHDATEFIGIAYDQEDADLIWKLLGRNQIPDRWNTLQKVYKSLGYDKSMQFNTYNGAGHGMHTAMFTDMVNFFTSNNGNNIVKIKAHNESDIPDWYEKVKKMLDE